MFIDFSKAFDTLPHKKILNILSDIGIRGKTLDLFENYFENRHFCVNMRDTISESQKVKFGVPQGSKLGPLLSILYCNNMLKNIGSENVFAYADDTAVLVADKDLLNCEKKMQEELNKISKWCHDYGIVINAEKTKIMHIRPRHMQSNRLYVVYRNFCKKNKSPAFNN